MLIALGHRRGVGKNTTGELLAKSLRAEGKTVQILSFASSLKKVAHMLYAWGGMQTEAHYEFHYDEKEIILPLIGKSPRTIWIEIGNKMREIHPKTWIKNVLEEGDFDYTILTDGRYPNELNAVRDLGGLVIKVVNDKVPKHSDVADSAAKDYTSWDWFINNGGDVIDLEIEVNKFIIGRLDVK